MLSETMKQVVITIFLLWAAIGLQAQTAYEEIMKDIHKSAGYHYAYPGPSQAHLTPAPVGKKPFYLSHYGRHGSRHCTKKDRYDVPYMMLAKADSLGKLTALGKDVLRRVGMIRDEAYGRWGELTSIGAKQQRQIARRMVERFPEVFEGDRTLDAKSTTVVRCILSMENALMQISSMMPRLRIHHDASNHDTYYMVYDDKPLKAHRMDSTVMARLKVYEDKYDHSETLMKALFNDMDYVNKEVDGRKLANAIFELASNLQDTETCRKITLYDLFTDEELYDHWKLQNMQWYVKYGRCPLNGGKQPYAQRHLLRKMIEEADSCIRLEQPGPSLRYGHDSVLMPLLSLMGVNNYGLATDNLDAVDKKGWVNYKGVAMGGNLQLVFYRSNPQDEDVLVQVLLNENEATLPIKTDEAPYYHWNDVRDYYLKMLDEYQP